MALCRSTLQPIAHEGLSAKALTALSGKPGGRFPHQLPFTRDELITETQPAVQQRRMSLSGAQLKCSLKLYRGKLTLARPGELATHILKPIPTLPFQHASDVPANEHLTMQIAAQCFGLSTAPNALIMFADGEPVYITKRFDRDRAGNALNQEDFCQLSNETSPLQGEDFKYDGSYEALGKLLQTYSRAPIIDLRRYFTLIIFNIIFSNGDAHKKNFSLLEYAPNDYRLSPAYDLLCTRLHCPDESRMALNLFADTEETPFFLANGFHGREDFITFGQRLGLRIDDINVILNQFPKQKDNILRLIDHSFLTTPSKSIYTSYLLDRLQLL